MSLITETVADATRRTERVAIELLALHRRIKALPDLRPSPHVNAAFTELVRLIVETPDELDVHEHPQVQAIADELRGIASRAEVELEYEWSRRIASSDEPDAELRRFPYLDNYRKLCRVEAGLIEAGLDDAPQSVAFVGCGPLPLTSLILAQELDAHVVNIDRDFPALEAATQVSAALGLANVEFFSASAQAVDVSGFDVVVLAAMVGTTDAEKRAVLAGMRASMRPGAVLLARSARGLRALLYPPIPSNAFAGFDVRAVVHPLSAVVNSVILARPAR